MTERERRVIVTLYRGATIVAPGTTKVHASEEDGHACHYITHHHFEPFGMETVPAEVDLVPVASGRFRYGVCTCGAAFLADTGTPDA